MNRSVEVAKATHSEDASSIPEYRSSGGRQRIDFLARKFPGVKVRKVGADARPHRDFQSAASILHEMPGQLLVSKQKLRRAEAMACVRLKRQEGGPEPGVCVQAVCTLWAADQTAGCRRPSSRTPEWPVRPAGDRTSQLRSALGTGPAGTHFSRDARDSPANTADHF